MNTKTMTLYEALEERKLLQKKVDNIRTFRLVESKKKNSDVSADGIALDDVRKQIQSGYDQSVAVFNNYVRLKAAINEANAKIEVDVAGEKYTIANAIIRQRMLDDEERLYQAMIRNYNAVLGDVQRANNKNLDPQAVAAYVTKNLGESSKRDQKLIDNLSESYRKDVELEVYDPLNTKEKAEAKLEKIAAFRSAIHFALNKANIEHTITVDYE